MIHKVKGCGDCPLRDCIEDEIGCGHPNGLFVQRDIYNIPNRCPLHKEPITIELEEE